MKGIFSNIEIINLVEKAKEYTVKKLLKLKNDLLNSARTLVTLALVGC